MGGVIAGFLASRCGKLDEQFYDREHFRNVDFFNEIIEQLMSRRSTEMISLRQETGPDERINAADL